ncbi:hypothetical protein [Providencia rettgeri]|uniref:hypothetical protein n=1 Tax=Providencia rettgeri TaxID=587 RepID=UPI000807AEBE|nr:hypothetical protein [Providencia rettgeri]MDL9989507.1 hypothetical protein [Providencia rettgeri]OBY34583.1 hypothetical protein PR729_23470 [Providencia rettgeri]
MSYRIEDLKFSGASREIAAIKLALSVIAWSRDEANGNDIVRMLRQIPMKEVQDLANDIDKLNPKNAK